MSEATRLEDELRSYGVDVESLETGECVDLTYTTAFPGDSVDHAEMGRALNALVDLASMDVWDPVRVEATVVRSPGDVLGRWHAEADWFERLSTYELSETEFSSLVLETLEETEP